MTLQRYEEAEAAYRQAMALDPTDAECLNSLGWLLFSTDKNIEEAEAKLRQAVAIAPDDLAFLHTLACILVRQDQWKEAALLARRFLTAGDEAFYIDNWSRVVLSFFREAIKTGHTEDAVQLLDDIGYEDRWRPLREALRAIAAGNDAPLLYVAPEIRQPAEELVAPLLPEGVKLASSMKTPRGKKTRRQRSG